MTKQTIVAVFDDFSQARDAVNALESGGIPHSDISIVANDADKRHSTQMGSNVDDRSDAGDGAKKGALESPKRSPPVRAVAPLSMASSTCL